MSFFSVQGFNGSIMAGCKRDVNLRVVCINMRKNFVVFQGFDLTEAYNTEAKMRG